MSDFKDDELVIFLWNEEEKTGRIEIHEVKIPGEQWIRCNEDKQLYLIHEDNIRRLN